MDARYRGHAVLAQSVLPINPDTIVYGSADQGKTIHNDDAKIDQQMQAAAKILNLKVQAIMTVYLHLRGILYGKRKEIRNASYVPPRTSRFTEAQIRAFT